MGRKGKDVERIGKNIGRKREIGKRIERKRNANQWTFKNEKRRDQKKRGAEKIAGKRKNELNLREKQLLESNRANSSLTKKTHSAPTNHPNAKQWKRKGKGFLQHGRSPQKKRQRKTRNERRV